MRIAGAETGYVGLTTGVALAHLGHRATFIYGQLRPDTLGPRHVLYRRNAELRAGAQTLSRRSQRRRPNLSLAQRLQGWEPRVPVREGLNRSIAYFAGLLG